MKVLLFILLGTLISKANNSCSCQPTTNKTYIGEARQKSFFGFTVHWICDYQCETDSGHSELVKGTYKDFYLGSLENGLEGICEGMKYDPYFNVDRNDYIYMWDGKIRSINPRKSKANELVQWARLNSCN